MQHTLRNTDELPSWLKSRADEFDVNDDGYLVWVGKDANGVKNTWRDGINTANQAAKCAGSHALAAVSGGCGWGSQFSANGFTYRWGEPFRGWDEVNNEVQRVKLGSSLPDVAFGFNTNIRYKAVSAYLGFRGAVGGKVYNDSRQWQYNQLRHGDLDQTGIPAEEQKPLDYYQRALYNGNNWTDEFLEDGSFLKLGEARVAYRLQRASSRRFLGAMAPSEINFGINARNLYTWKKFRGFDPEQGSPLSRVVSVGYPHLRTLTATVDIVF